MKRRTGLAVAADKAAGALIRSARTDRGVTAEELGRRIGLWKNTVLKLERGEQTISVKTLISVALALNVPATSLVPEPEDVAA